MAAQSEDQQYFDVSSDGSTTDHCIKEKYQEQLLLMSP